jgi:hypothetical protein
LAQGPAKLITQFRRNFERNLNSARMVPGITRTELHPECPEQNPFLLTTPDHSQIERQRLPTLDLGIINKENSCLPLPPRSSTTPTQRRRIATVTNGCHHPLLLLIAPNDNGTPQYRKNTTRAPRHRPRSMRQPHVTQGRSSGEVLRRQQRRGNLTNNEQRCSLSLAVG